MASSKAMSPTRFRGCAWTLLLLGFLEVAPHFAGAQTAADGNSPKLAEPFTFTLGQPRDYALDALITSLEQHDVVRRSEELEAAHAPALSQALDLLRYVPISLGGSEGAADFFTPAYLQPDYARLPATPSLFDTR